MDRGRDTGYALTEMRTVLNRARTAREAILCPLKVDGVKYDFVNGEFVITDEGHRDPDESEMIEALDNFIAAAEKWQRTGRKKNA